MKTTRRIQEALADRFSFIQYPNIKPADTSTREHSRTGLRFEHAMPFGKRLDLILMSTLLLLFGLAALGLVGLFIYCLL